MAKFSTGEKMKIFKDMVVVVDTRENKWQHIQKYFESKNIKYEIRKLDVGDYTFILPNYPELEMDNLVIIERKANLSELAGNFTKGRERFKNEFERLQPHQKIHMVLETFTWKKLFNGTYRSSFTPNSYKASLITYAVRYNCPCWFAEVSESPEIIYKIMYYELNERIK